MQATLIHDQELHDWSYVMPSLGRLYLFREVTSLRQEGLIDHYEYRYEKGPTDKPVIKSVTQQLTQPKARYGIRWEALTSPDEQRHGLHGDRVSVFDLNTKDVLATRTIYFYAVSSGTATASGRMINIPHPAQASWFQTCRNYSLESDSQYRDGRPHNSYAFVSRVLRPINADDVARRISASKGEGEPSETPAKPPQAAAPKATERAKSEPEPKVVPFTMPTPPAGNAGAAVGGKSACALPGLFLPDPVRVYAAGAYAGRKLDFQIDQSGSQATQMDVAVNSPTIPVVLLLGAYDPTVWNIGWTTGTKVLAVHASGYHRQVVAGLPKGTPILTSTYEEKGPCGWFYVTESSLTGLNGISRRLFQHSVDQVFLAKEGRVLVGEVLNPGSALVTSPDTPPESFFDKTAPLAGQAGLTDAVKKGLIRPATSQDIDAWVEALAAAQSNRDVPPIAGIGKPKPARPYAHHAYVVLKEFALPAGLYGAHSATFFVPKGVPPPVGNPGHSAIYDFNTMKCQGGICAH
jgi:hypothetical protein